jgi:predicted RNA-binding Zn-ribbon protein involved in translation (DUF1610 family)
MGRDAARVHCVACGKPVGVRMLDAAETTPAFACDHCGQAVHDSHVLYANLKCARVEMAQLAATIGHLLLTLTGHDEARRDQLVRHADAIHLEIEGGPAVAALVGSMMRRT